MHFISLICTTKCIKNIVFQRLLEQRADVEGAYSTYWAQFETAFWEEEVNVAVGPENGFSPGAPDQGQPTRFLPRRNRFVFKVRVPADWGKKELIWTLTTKGKTERAYGTLREDSLVDNLVQASEQGAIGAGISSPEIRANQPPTLSMDGGDRRAQVQFPWAPIIVQPVSHIRILLDLDQGHTRANRVHRTGGQIDEITR